MAEGAAVPDAASGTETEAETATGTATGTGTEAETKRESETERVAREVERNLAAAARYRRAGNRIKELFYLQRAVKADPQSREAMYRLGAALVENGQKELGCARLDRAGNVAKALYEKTGCGGPGEH
jgi:hypothetical protein